MIAWLLGCAASTEESGQAPDAACPLVEELPDKAWFQDCLGGVCEVAAGPFVMGSEEPDACPQRLVSLSAFRIDEVEVSRSLWGDCVAAGACPELPACLSPAPVQDPGALPVGCVGAEEAQRFCAWRGGTLPTEAQWEKAARGNRGQPFPWGEEQPSCALANLLADDGVCHGGPVEVGGYPTRSPYGLADVGGNVWEWVADDYDAGWYAEAPDLDPSGPERCRAEPGAEPGPCTERVVRGGAFDSPGPSVGASWRGSRPAQTRDLNIGFRCAYL